jgi:S1-C subfamily serine protease
MIAAGVGIALAAGGVGAGIGLALRGGQSSSGSPSASGAANPTTIAAAIDPSIVDINDVINGSPAAGTGIIITSSGEVLTNNHVIAEATNITAQVDGQGPTYSVKVLGYDATDDVALLQIENAPTLKAAPLGSSSALRVGDQVVALGNAEGRGGTPATASGTVTGLDQTVTASDGATSETLNGTIQVAVDIVPGDSGGPLVDAAGQVVGMDTAGSSSGATVPSGTGSSATTGFAIPIETAMSIAHQIQSRSASGNVVIGGSGPLIGVEVENAPSAAAPSGGAVIAQVVAGSPAASAGLQAGDVIVSVDGTPITSVGDLSTALKGDRPGQTIQLGWLDSSGTQHTTSITLAAGPPA